MLTNFEILLVRACKATEPEKRLRSLYGRYYLRKMPQDVVSRVMADRILKLAKKCDIDLVDVLVEQMNPEKKSRYINIDNTTYSYNRHLMLVVMTKIRFTGIHAFKGYRSPCMHRNKTTA